MPTQSNQFVVESYKVQVIQKPGGPERTLSLTSPPSSKGIRTKATILFQKTNPFGSIIGAVETTSIELVAWSDPALFNSLYALLVNEKPVTGTYEYETDAANPKNTSWNLKSVGLRVDTEMPGDFEK